MSKDSSTAGKRLSPANYLWVAAIAAIVGFAAVYWTMGPSDNGEVDMAAPSTQVTSDQVASPGANPGTNSAATEATNEVKPFGGDKLNTGHMATFVFKDQPAPLPEISFKDKSGSALTLADFKGKAVLLNLWATWCAPCREEMPALDRLQEKLGGDKFEVVALSVDQGGAQKSQEFLDKIKIANLSLYIDETASATAPLKVIGMPTTLLIDAQGREIGRLIGPAEWDSPEAVRLVEAHIK